MSDVVNYDPGAQMRPRLRPGQRELRDNLRAVIADSGRSQSAVCMDAGLVLYHLSAVLSEQNWMPPERVAALAEALDVSPDELMGASMYKGETWLEARRRQGGTDWRHCPRWCSADRHDVYGVEDDGRVLLDHCGPPWGDGFWFHIVYCQETGSEVDRLVSIDGFDETLYRDTAPLASLTQHAHLAASWLRGEVVLP